MFWFCIMNNGHAYAQAKNINNGPQQAKILKNIKKENKIDAEVSKISYGLYNRKNNSNTFSISYSQKSINYRKYPICPM